jgi:hypothetical protein
MKQINRKEEKGDGIAKLLGHPTTDPKVKR